jgi:hypothetical protein
VQGVSAASCMVLAVTMGAEPPGLPDCQGMVWLPFRIHSLGMGQTVWLLLA